MEEEVSKLEKLLEETDDFDEKMEIMDKILELKRELGVVKPPESPYECLGCSS